MILDAFWRRPRNPYAIPGNTAPRATLERSLEFQRTMARALVAAGVPLMAGSDALNPTILPGKALWQEVVELEKSGLTPYQALRTATIVPGQQYRRFSKRGVVTPGWRADLVLLSRNPLASVGNLASIRGTMVGGRWMTIDAMRARMRDYARPGASAPK